MPRNLTSGELAQLSASQIAPVVFVECDFASGAVYLWTGRGNYSWNGHTWVGVGKLGQISVLNETSDVSAQSVTISLSGIPSDMLSDALNEVQCNQMVTIWLGFFTATGTGGWSLVSSPAIAYQGFMDVPTIEEGVETSTISLSLENRLIILNRAKMRRYDTQDQAIDYPSDLGFEFVPFLQLWEGSWGAGYEFSTANGAATHSPVLPTGGGRGPIRFAGGP